MRVSSERTLVTISGRNKNLQREGETGPTLCCAHKAVAHGCRTHPVIPAEKEWRKHHCDGRYQVQPQLTHPGGQIESKRRVGGPQ